MRLACFGGSFRKDWEERVAFNDHNTEIRIQIETSIHFIMSEI